MRTDQTRMKLGKQAPRHDPRTFLFATYFRGDTLPPPPASENWAARVRDWPMMANDRIGDCTCAAAGHMIEQWTTYAGRAAVPADKTIIAAYSAIAGYDPRTGANDNGAVELDVLNYWRHHGIASHKILAYVALEPKNHLQVKDAVLLFGNCYIGLALPQTAQRQVVWTVPPGGPTGAGAPGSWGGHAVPVVAYDERGLICVTWGMLKRMTWTFWDAYCDEAYAVLSKDWINKVSDQAPNRFDLVTLQKDLEALRA